MNDRHPSSPATVLLFIAILIGFGIEIATGAWKDQFLLAPLGAIVPSLILDQGQYWRLLSAMFLHGDGTVRGGLLHLGVNLYALWQLGRLYEIMFGTRRFVMIYFVTGIAASLTSLLRYVLLQQDGASVGASGAIFGVLGAFIFSIRRSPRWRNERWARSIVQQLLFWIVVNIAIGLTVPQIDMAAHVGGLLTGLLLGATLPQKEPPLPPSQAVIDVTPTQSP
ncbi:MAG TPA: rhomboid family intramembrane serine protease [Thermoanaerobaculia bacterium]|nr:rhomboid family intramembrane serine protease [Thermoanaerobaculia bacterium]